MSQEFTTILTPPIRNNFFLQSVGAAMLVLNKIRKMRTGYNDPRGFSSTEIERGIEYDFSVVDSWEKYLDFYLKGENLFEGKHILELGPGADLGIGIILLDRGAKQYSALDKHNLISGTPTIFYEKLMESSRLKSSPEQRKKLMGEVQKTLQNNPSKLVYRADPHFSIREITPKVDLVVSHAAFEHFDDLGALVKDITAVVKTGGVVCAQIDLQTHSRWIREADPNNIYRYSDWFYNLCRFSGSPNRWRPYEYKEAFEKEGWNVTILPLHVLAPQILKHVQPSLASRFQNKKNEMSTLTCMLLATKK